ncbi:hypothetical protein [Niveispirillum fermenti]|uniref:hypothetical protein n=1 Tax=Niveispirillum fermenti TaxID=1233113 RepID=UPI003A8C1C80
MLKMKDLSVLLFCSMVSLPGCSKPEEATAPKAANSEPAVDGAAASVVAPTEAIPEKAVAPVVPVADRSKPLATYEKLDSGRKLLFAYLAVGTQPVEYEKVAGLISPGLSYADEFKKRDLIQSLRPGIDAEIEQAKGIRYYYMDMSGILDKYDFDSKSFRFMAFANDTPSVYFPTTGNYSMVFTNAVQYRRFTVTDEAKARQIETLRAEASNMKSKVYFFTTGEQLGEKIVNAEIVKVQLLDPKGNLLVEM